MNIFLFGNPNCGKSTLFNLLTGLRQKVGNFPGVTVEKKTGVFSLHEEKHTLIDFPGVYSIYPKSQEELVVYEALKEIHSSVEPRVGVVVVDASNFERGLFLFSQLADLGIPLVLVINMIDLAERNGITIHLDALKNELKHTPIAVMNARVGLGKDRLLNALAKQIKEQKSESYFAINSTLYESEAIAQQEAEAINRQQSIKNMGESVVGKKEREVKKSKLDWWLTHPIIGYALFALILLVMFQAVFTLSSYPMDAIEWLFQRIAVGCAAWIPAGVFQDLICAGILPGISGVLVFIPQIALLFFFIALLEDSGYLARAVFLMDRLVRPFGMNGRSVVPLLSSMACAIPGIMATRGIPNSKERLITLFVAPLMSCSARIPVYTLLISVVIPKQRLFGIVQLQGLVLFALYILGIISALGIAFILHRILKQTTRSLYLMEIPDFKPPHWRNIFTTIIEKIKVFTLEAGGIILALSIVIWGLSNYGPTEERAEAITQLKTENVYKKGNALEKTQLESAVLLEHSFLGKFGKTIEPAIAPLGYDWKIGIAISSSFLAREVFVGTLSTIYAHDEASGSFRLREKLMHEMHADGTKKFTLASGISLMVFYVFALQCLSTMAVARRETGSWKIPLAQLFLYGALAYVSALICFHFF